MRSPLIVPLYIVFALWFLSLLVNGTLFAWQLGVGEWRWDSLILAVVSVCMCLFLDRWIEEEENE